MATTNERDVLNCLVANNERLASTNATTLTNGANAHTNIDYTSDFVAAAVRGSTSSEVVALKRKVQQLKSEIRFKWMNGGFCSTH